MAGLTTCLLLLRGGWAASSRTVNLLAVFSTSLATWLSWPRPTSTSGTDGWPFEEFTDHFQYSHLNIHCFIHILIFGDVILCPPPPGSIRFKNKFFRGFGILDGDIYSYINLAVVHLSICMSVRLFVCPHQPWLYLWTDFKAKHTYGLHLT